MHKTIFGFLIILLISINSLSAQERGGGSLGGRLSDPFTSNPKMLGNAPFNGSISRISIDPKTGKFSLSDVSVSPSTKSGISFQYVGQTNPFGKADPQLAIELWEDAHKIFGLTKEDFVAKKAAVDLFNKSTLSPLTIKDLASKGLSFGIKDGKTFIFDNKTGYFFVSNKDSSKFLDSLLNLK